MGRLSLKSTIFTLVALLSFFSTTSFSSPCILSLEDLSGPVKYDVVIIGAGPAGITTAASLSRQNPELKILIAEKSSGIGGTFRDHGQFYRMSTRLDGATTGAYPFPKDLKAKLEKSYGESKADLIFNAPLVKFEDQWTEGTKSNGRYFIELAEGTQVRADALVFASGQKPSVFEGFEPEPRKFLTDEVKRHGNRVLTFDQVIAKYKDGTVDLKSQNIGVFGAGIAAFNLVDFLVNKTDTKIYWHVKSMARVKKKMRELGDRYSSLITDIENNPRIHVEEQKVSEITKTSDAKSYKIGSKVIDEIWIAAGSSDPQVSDLPGAHELKGQLLPIFNETINGAIGKRLKISGRPPQAIYLAGTTAGSDLVFPGDVRPGVSPLALSVMIPRSEALAKLINEELVIDKEKAALPLEVKNKIIKYFDERALPEARPEIIFMAGIPGSGKSTFTKKFDENHVIVDPDRIMELISGYYKTFLNAPESAASDWHTDVTELQFPLVDRALLHSKNIIIDGTMKKTSFFKDFVERIRRENPQYIMKLYYVPCAPEIAKARVIARAKAEGRYLPEMDFEQIQKDVEETIHVVSPFFDEVKTLE